MITVKEGPWVCVCFCPSLWESSSSLSKGPAAACQPTHRVPSWKELSHSTPTVHPLFEWWIGLIQMLSSDKTTKPTAKWILSISGSKANYKEENLKTLRIITFIKEWDAKWVRATTHNKHIFYFIHSRGWAEHGQRRKEYHLYSSGFCRTWEISTLVTA